MISKETYDIKMDENREPLVWLAVDDALKTAPFTLPPAGLLVGVMAQINVEKERPRFRLAWSDLAASLCVSSVLTALLLVINWLPKTWIQRVELDLLWIQHWFHYMQLDQAFIPVTGICLGILFLAGLYSLLARQLKI